METCDQHGQKQTERGKKPCVRCQVSCVTCVSCYLSLTKTATTTDPPPDISPIMHSRLVRKDPQPKNYQKSLVHREQGFQTWTDRQTDRQVTDIATYRLGTIAVKMAIFGKVSSFQYFFYPLHSFFFFFSRTKWYRYCYKGYFLL